MEQEIYLNRRRATDSRARLEAIQGLSQQHENQREPDQVIVIKPSEPKPVLFDQIILDKPKFAAQNIEADEIEQVGKKRENSELLAVGQAQTTYMIDTTKDKGDQWKPTRFNTTNFTLASTKQSDFNVVQQRHYSKNLESFRKIKLSEKKSAEAQQKEDEDGQLELSIVTGCMQMQTPGRKILENKEKLYVSKSQNISEISLNEDQ